MHVARIVKRRQGREYTSWLVRQSYRAEGTVKHRTLANISALPLEAIELVRGCLAGRHFIDADAALRIERSLSHGHVVAVLGCLRNLRLEQVLDRVASHRRSVALAMIAANVIQPVPGLDYGAVLAHTSLLTESGLADTVVDEALLEDTTAWLLTRKPSIEKRLARRYVSKSGLYLYSRTTNFGVACNPEGCPIAVETFTGTNSGSITSEEIERLRRRFRLAEMVLVVDDRARAAITLNRLREIPGMQWIAALRAPNARLLRQRWHPDPGRLVEIGARGHPGERIILRSPAEGNPDYADAIRTSLPRATMTALQVARAYDNVLRVQRELKRVGRHEGELVTLRWSEKQVRFQLFIRLLADHVRWHMERDLAPLLSRDAPSRLKADPSSVRSLRDLIVELATMTTNVISVSRDGSEQRFSRLSEPTETQRTAFELLGLPLLTDEPTAS
jgi:hypothetical protein